MIATDDEHTKLGVTLIAKTQKNMHTYMTYTVYSKMYM